MLQLIGNLSGIGLSRLAQFLTELEITGRLCVAIEDGATTGTVWFEGGKIVGATVDSHEDGLVALEALALVSSTASFAFADSPVEMKHNVDVEPAVLREHLSHLDQDGPRLMQSIRSLGAIPRVALADIDVRESISLSRDALRLLLDIRGDQTVLELSHRHGLRATIEHTYELVQLRLLRVGDDNSVSLPATAPAFANLLEQKGQKS